MEQREKAVLVILGVTKLMASNNGLKMPGELIV